MLLRFEFWTFLYKEEIGSLLPSSEEKINHPFVVNYKSKLFI